ncbi:MAG: ComEC/Rec2 family competence protein, partial [Candidatus Electryoneaceae bacterium]|nr:ComEC/Rec2 family competence protein [Candidatus Electryoneaceae bacterium]
WSPSANDFGTAALIILMIRPGDLFDAGFQLSFAAVGGIMLYHPHSKTILSSIKQQYGRLGRLTVKYILNPLFVSFSATIMVLPLTSYHFGSMALGAPLFNLLAIPLLWFLYVVSWVVVLFSTIWSWGAGIIAEGLYLVLIIWRETVSLFGHYAPLWDIRLTPLTIGLCVGLLIWVASRKKRFFPRLILMALAVAALLTWDGIRPMTNRFQVWFLDVGNGDAAVWRFPDGRTVVVDGGPIPWGRTQGKTIGVLKYWGCRKIDLMVATHNDYDHIAGLTDVIEQYPVSIAIASPIISTSRTYAKLCSLSIDYNVYWYNASAGMEVNGFDRGYRLKIVGPPYGVQGWTTNDASVALLLEVPTENGQPIHLLTAGDIEQVGEEALVRSGDIGSELLKVSHHGSKTSSSSAFLSAVQPHIAVMTRAGRFERGRSLEVIRRFDSLGVDLHYTDKEGAILLEPDHHCVDGEVSCPTGETWRVVNWRQPSFFRWLLGR